MPPVFGVPRALHKKPPGSGFINAILPILFSLLLQLVISTDFIDTVVSAAHLSTGGPATQNLNGRYSRGRHNLRLSTDRIISCLSMDGHLLRRTSDLRDHQRHDRIHCALLASGSLREQDFKESLSIRSTTYLWLSDLPLHSIGHIMFTT